jgi:hypothetical protein
MRARNFLDTFEPDLILGGRPQAYHSDARFELECSGREPHAGYGAQLLHFDLVCEVFGHAEGEPFRLARSDDGVGPHATSRS